AALGSPPAAGYAGATPAGPLSCHSVFHAVHAATARCHPHHHAQWAMSGFGELAQWLQKRVPRGEGAAAEPVIPPGDGPLVLLCGPETGAVATALRRLCPPVRVGGLGQVAVEW